MSRIYTKTGDKGTTSLYDGNRIPKSSIFFAVLGDIDELSSNLGMLCALLKQDIDGVNHGVNRDEAHTTTTPRR